MDIYPTKVDRITQLQLDNSPYSTYRSVSHVKSGQYSSSKTSRVDTVHYLSPASSLSTLTELEGDIYHHFDVYRDTFMAKKTIDYGSSSSSKSSTTVACLEVEPQRTLAIIKPDAMKYKDVVLRAITTNGFRILNQRLLHLTAEQVSEVYEKYYGSSTFPYLVVSLSAAPMLVLSLGRKNAVDKWKNLVGPYGVLREEWFFPYSVRTRFGILSNMPETLHASENIEEAKRENRYFFPRSILEPIVVKEEKVDDYLTQYVKPILMEGLIKIVQIKPVDPVLTLAEWLLLNNPNSPKVPEEIALSPL